MIKLRSLALAFLTTLSLMTGSMAFVPTVVHAQVDAGLAEVGGTIGLSATDPRVIAARIINVTLGLLAIIMLCLILYAGFLWMTSGGNTEQVERAKLMIRNAIIGVVLILSSWAIASFVINSLLSATGGGGGGSIAQQLTPTSVFCALPTRLLLPEHSRSQVKSQPLSQAPHVHHQMKRAIVLMAIRNSSRRSPQVSAHQLVRRFPVADSLLLVKDALQPATLSIRQTQRQLSPRHLMDRVFRQTTS
jgi:hypothetical protein